MALKSSFLWFCLFLSIALGACSPNVQPSPTTDQKAIATGVAATLDAVATATQRAMLTSHPAEISSPTPEPTETQAVLPSETSTQVPTATISLPPHPDGLIAYTKNNDVHIWTPKDGASRLTDMHDVVSVLLSDDGALVAFKRQDPEEITLQELWVVNTSGVSNPLRVVSSDELAALVPSNVSSSILGYGIDNFAWRPKTHQLAYNTLVLHEGPGYGPNHDVRLVDVNTLEKSTLFDTGQGGFFYYSPDGNQIALSNPESISLVNADGNNLRRDALTYPDVITYSEYAYHPHPIWAADSASLGVTIPPHDPLGDPAPLTGLWRIPVDGSPAVLLASIPAIPFAWPDHAFAPDLTLVAYSADASGDGLNLRDLHISNVDGSDNGVYASGEALEFNSWSPDSQHFSYAIQGGNDEGLYIGGLNDSPILLIYDPHSVKDIKWLDGTRFVFLMNTNNEWGLHLGNVDGEFLALVDNMPDASPDFDVVP